MQNLYNNIKSSGLAVAEYLQPVLRESQFAESGVLTPDEFVKAGDHLVHHCPSWRWQAGDSSCRKDYLPPEKQMLVTTSVPCRRRCKDLIAKVDSNYVERLVDAPGDAQPGEEWVEACYDEDANANELDSKAVEMEPTQAKPKPADEKAVRDNPPDQMDDQEAVDMEDFMDADMLAAEEADSATVVRRQTNCSDPMDSITGEIVHTRTYDLHITYDKYYQTPRLWLTGFNEKHSPLSVDEMYDDFSGDHANKTITVEKHPHLVGEVPHASVHPCRHAATMKRLYSRMQANDDDSSPQTTNQATVDVYLIIFLKFMQSIIPTIEYDFTRDVVL